MKAALYCELGHAAVQKWQDIKTQAPLIFGGAGLEYLSYDCESKQGKFVEDHQKDS